MTTNTLGGLTARHALALALRTELGLPLGSTGSSALTFAAVERPTITLVEAMGRKALEDRQDAVVTFWPSPWAAEPETFALFFRTMRGMDVLQVHPVATGKGGPLVLVAEDGRVFALDERGCLAERTGGSVADTPARRKRGLARLRRAAARLRPETACGAWEVIHLAPPSGGAAYGRHAAAN